MPTRSDAHLRGLLAQTGQDLTEAERRRAHQARIVSELLAGTDTRASAEKVLREINRTVAFTRANHELIGHILA